MPYSEVTDGIRIEVVPQYVEAQSKPQAGRYVFSYTITIHNGSGDAAQLLNRHWRILHGDGKQEEVKGPGVVGEQPHLAPGQSHTYSSFCILATPNGSMQGSYEMVRPDGSRFDVKIPAFSLSVPYSLN